jgi:hypothetical protein
MKDTENQTARGNACEENALNPPKPIEFKELRPLEEFSGRNRELFLRAFFHFGASLLRDFKTGDPKIDAENEDGDGERVQLNWLLTRSLFASYEAMKILGVKPKLSSEEEFNASNGKDEQVMDLFNQAMAAVPAKEEKEDEK